MNRAYRMLFSVMVCAAVTTIKASMFEIKRSDVEEVEIKAKEIIARAKTLMTNPLFLSMLVCISYVGPKTLVNTHPLLSVMGMGLILTYLKGDNMLVDVEGAELRIALLKKKNGGAEKTR